MKINYLLIVTILLGLGLSGCKHSVQREANVASGTVSGKDTDVARQVMNTAAQIYAKPEVPVLCYHRIEDGKKSEYNVSPATFSSHMKILADSGYHSILPAQLYDYLVYNKTLPEKPFLITFDDSRV